MYTHTSTLVWLDAGLLALRVLLAGLVAAHALQKSLGWFSGKGLTATAAIFHAVGFRPGRLMVLVATAVELLTAVLLALGLLTPFAGAALFAVMLVASSVHWRFGPWADRGGYELPVVYALIALVLALTGPGRWSLDAALGLHVPDWVPPIALLVGLLAAAGAIAQRSLLLRRDAT